jgi:hypothetical protein
MNQRRIHGCFTQSPCGVIWWAERLQGQCQHWMVMRRGGLVSAVTISMFDAPAGLYFTGARHFAS